MIHRFDTGNVVPQRTLIRAAVVAALRPLLIEPNKEPQGYLRAIVPFAGTVRGRDDELGIDLLYEALQGREPAVAVSVSDKAYQAGGVGGHQWTAELDVNVYACTTHGRALDARQAPDVVARVNRAADPGVDVVLEHVEELLIGRPLGLPNVQRLRPIREEELAHTPELTLWAQTYRVPVGRDVNERRNVTRHLTSLWTQLNHDHPELAESRLAVAVSTNLETP